VTVDQRLLVRALGDYAFFIPAPAVSVVAAEGSESRPGLRPNQLVWQGFSPRRKLLAARADLRLRDSTTALPIRIRIEGAPMRPGPFELILSLENATRARVRTLSAEALETDVAVALRALRAAARAGRPIDGRAVRIRGSGTPATVDVSAPFALRGTIGFPAGSVRRLRPAAFSGAVGGARPSALRVTVRGVALRAAAPTIRVLAQPVASAQPAAHTLEGAVRAYGGYARARQYQTFLANPDPRGPSLTTYVFETASTELPAARPEQDPSDDGGLPWPVVAAGLAMLGLGLAVLWAHS
jgi:hypothetical protein